jgi:putative hemolysin
MPSKHRPSNWNSWATPHPSQAKDAPAGQPYSHTQRRLGPVASWRLTKRPVLHLLAHGRETGAGRTGSRAPHGLCVPAREYQRPQEQGNAPPARAYCARWGVSLVFSARKCEPARGTVIKPSRCPTEISPTQQWPFSTQLPLIGDNSLSCRAMRLQSKPPYS